MSDRIARVNAFLHAYWHDDVATVEALIHPDFIWDNVSFTAFDMENGDIALKRPRVREGLAGLGSRRAMLFRDAATGEMVGPADGGGHEVISEAEAADGTVLQERIDLASMRGAVIKMRCVGVFRFKGDRIAEWCDYFDMAHWNTQVALLGLEYAGYATDAAG